MNRRRSGRIEVDASIAQFRTGLAQLNGRDIQYFDMKQMAEIQERFRNRVRSMVRMTRLWKADYESEFDEIERTYTAYEGIFIRRQLQDAWDMYLAVNKDYHEMKRLYLASLRRPPQSRVA